MHHLIDNSLRPILDAEYFPSRFLKIIKVSLVLRQLQSQPDLPAAHTSSARVVAGGRPQDLAGACPGACVLWCLQASSIFMGLTATVSSCSRSVHLGSDSGPLHWGRSDTQNQYIRRIVAETWSACSATVWVCLLAGTANEQWARDLEHQVGPGSADLTWTWIGRVTGLETAAAVWLLGWT